MMTMFRFSFLPLRRAALTVALVAVLPVAVAKPAHAVCEIYGAEPWWQTAAFNSLQTNYLENTFYQTQFVNDFYRNRIVRDLWENNIRRALMEMTAQLIAARVQMTGAIGGMLDGQIYTEHALKIQELHARALKDYTPGETLCRFGTGVRSLAQADARTNLTQVALAELAENRLMNTRGSGTDTGADMDRLGRFDAFRRLYCNPGDNNGKMAELCNVGANPVSVPARFNKDIDVARTLDSKLTLDVDFTNNTTTADEEDLLALSSNLYAHNIFEHFQTASLSNTPGDTSDQTYLDLRQVAALHSVAQNSFDVVAGMRARGAGGSAQYLINVLREMGMTESEARRYLAGVTADNGEPSYYAQMEILTKRLYQNPNFYVNLIDKPANVKRQLTAMKGFELMQNRDIFESMQRQEMLMSLLLELEVRDAQSTVEREIDSMLKK